MHRNVAILFVVLASLVLAVRSDEALKCYMCTSVTDKDCGNDIIKSKTIEPIECTMEKMTKWQRSIQQNKLLTPIFSIFAVDDPQHDQSLLKNMACAKVDVKSKDNENKLLTIRSCQTAQAENVDPCTSIEGKLQGAMEFCGLCEENGCNGSMTISPRINHIILTVLGSFLIALILYRDA
ncbi:uncharacterized protein LOC122523393 [Polistes fuscatus]|uniref:uncharacterized protein LOC122523393 n=1 Tax=Polistes fuscatus TaxID=30207 RepID=UPI001CA8B401|nr:uncharacterized protein LOC122523393 [Polistes fuscatus]